MLVFRWLGDVRWFTYSHLIRSKLDVWSIFELDCESSSLSFACKLQWASVVAITSACLRMSRSKLPLWKLEVRTSASWVLVEFSRSRRSLAWSYCMEISGIWCLRRQTVLWRRFRPLIGPRCSRLGRVCRLQTGLQILIAQDFLDFYVCKNESLSTIVASRSNDHG
jgi:hypothetical protein